ncbi:MAG: PilZ domain-containing protein [Myxococcales bacterium]|nr:PilZ domain-containing protein [Myxococcales bacterium]
MKDRRAAERHKLMMYLKVHHQVTNELVGHVVDLSTGGLMLVAGEPFQPKSYHQLKVVLPLDEDQERTMDVDVECCWCGPDVNDAYYDAGFRFLSLCPSLNEMISDVVEDLGFMVV